MSTTAVSSGLVEVVYINYSSTEQQCFKMDNTSIGLLMEIVKPTTTAAAVKVCNFNCGAVCNNDACADQNQNTALDCREEDPTNIKDIYRWDQSEERTSKLEDQTENHEDHDQSAKPNYSEYARDCEKSLSRQPSEHDLVHVSSADIAEEGCLFGEFGFGHFILDLFSSLNPFRWKNLKNELARAKESNTKLEWELKTQLLRLRQEREAMESKLRSEIDHEISQMEALQAYLDEQQQLENDLRHVQQVSETTEIINALETHKKETLRSKPLTETVSSTIGVSSSADSAELNVVFSLDRAPVAAE